MNTEEIQTALFRALKANDLKSYLALEDAWLKGYGRGRKGWRALIAHYTELLKDEM